MKHTTFELALAVSLATACILVWRIGAPVFTRVIAILAASIFLASLALSDFLR